MSKKKKTEIVNVTRLRKDLKVKLDKIDDNIERNVFNGFYESRLRIEMGMWKKGKAIDVFFRGVKNTFSYYELEKRTGRRRANLKRWHKLYQAFPNKQDYRKIAEEKAQSWTTKVFEKAASPIPLLSGEQGKLVGDGSPEPKAKVESKKDRAELFEKSKAKQKAYSDTIKQAVVLLEKITDFIPHYKLRDSASLAKLSKLRNLINKIMKENRESEKQKT